MYAFSAHGDGKCAEYLEFQDKLDPIGDRHVFRLRDYIGNPDTDFEKHLMDPSNEISLSTYLAVMNGSDKEKQRKIYEVFWNNPEGMKRAEKVKRSPPVGRDHKILNMLREKASEWSEDETIHAAELFVTPPQREMLVGEALAHVQRELNVVIRRSWYNLFEWRNRWNNFISYVVYDENGTKKGYFYLKVIKHGERHPQTVPLIPRGLGVQPLSLVVTPNNYNMPHEIVHAVHYCFQAFYDVPKQAVEIPAMIVERHIRDEYWDEFPASFIRKQVAVAIADLSSDDPHQFNEIFAKTANVTNAGDIASRFWHYGKYDKKYYTYVLGLIDFTRVKSIKLEPGALIRIGY